MGRPEPGTSRPNGRSSRRTGRHRSGRPVAGALAALLDLVERVRLEPVRLAVDARRGLAVGRIDETEDLAVLLVDPVLLVVDAVVALDLDVGLVGARDGLGRDTGDVVHVHVRRHRDLLLQWLVEEMVARRA